MLKLVRGCDLPRFFLLCPRLGNEDELLGAGSGQGGLCLPLLAPRLSPAPSRPPQVLENRTKDSKLEMEVLENLQELKELNQRQANVDFEAMLRQYKEYEEEQKRREQEEDEQEMK